MENDLGQILGGMAEWLTPRTFWFGAGLFMGTGYMLVSDLFESRKRKDTENAPPAL